MQLCQAARADEAKPSLGELEPSRLVIWILGAVSFPLRVSGRVPVSSEVVDHDPRHDGVRRTLPVLTRSGHAPYHSIVFSYLTTFGSDRQPRIGASQGDCFEVLSGARPV